MAGTSTLAHHHHHCPPSRLAQRARAARSSRRLETAHSAARASTRTRPSPLRVAAQAASRARRAPRLQWRAPRRATHVLQAPRPLQSRPLSPAPWCAGGVKRQQHTGRTARSGSSSTRVEGLLLTPPPSSPPQCPTGAYTAAPGSSACRLCPAGSFATAASGATSCSQVCVPGGGSPLCVCVWQPQQQQRMGGAVGAG